MTPPPRPEGQRTQLQREAAEIAEAFGELYARCMALHKDMCYGVDYSPSACRVVYRAAEKADLAALSMEDLMHPDDRSNEK